MIVNISSVFGIIGYPHQSAYNISKFGVRGLNESLRQELASTGVTVCSVHPGGVKTNIVKNSRHYRDEAGVEDREVVARRFEKMAQTTAVQAAATIADGMAKRAARILVGPDAYVIDAAARSAPVHYPAIMKALLRRLS
ncbi:MAG: SDR family NAD(P)-dependent oxidoreductase [Myxococcota bacterium]